MNKIKRWWRRLTIEPAIQPAPAPKKNPDDLLDKYGAKSIEELFGTVMYQSEKRSSAATEQTYHNISERWEPKPISIPDQEIPKRDGKLATIFVHVSGEPGRETVHEFEDIEGIDDLIEDARYEAHQRIAYFRSRTPIDLIRSDMQERIARFKELKEKLSQ